MEKIKTQKKHVVAFQVGADEEAEAKPEGKPRLVKSRRIERKKPGLSHKLRLAAHNTVSVAERMIHGLSRIYEGVFVGTENHLVIFDKEQGLKFYDGGDYPNALECFQSCIENGHVNDSDVFFLVAMCYVNLDKHKEALDYFKEAERLKPTDPDMIEEYAACRYVLEDYAGATVYFEKIVAKNPDNADQYYYLGNCYEKTEKIEEAKKMYKKAIDLDPREPLYYQSLGFIYENTGNHAEGIICLRKAMELERKQKKEGGGFSD